MNHTTQYIFFIVVLNHVFLICHVYCHLESYQGPHWKKVYVINLMGHPSKLNIIWSLYNKSITVYIFLKCLRVYPIKLMGDISDAGYFLSVEVPFTTITCH